MVEALAGKAGLSGFESHRYLHFIYSHLRSTWVQFALKIRCRLEASVLLSVGQSCPVDGRDIVTRAVFHAQLGA